MEEIKVLNEGRRERDTHTEKEQEHSRLKKKIDIENEERVINNTFQHFLFLTNSPNSE